jgi:hypothetical protein
MAYSIVRRVDAVSCTETVSSIQLRQSAFHLIILVKESIQLIFVKILLWTEVLLYFHQFITWTDACIFCPGNLEVS